MWLIIQTNTYKEKEIAEELHKVKGVKEYFLPLYRMEVTSHGAKRVTFAPLITHIVFLNLEIPEYKMANNRTKYLLGIFNNYSIKKKTPSTESGRQYTKSLTPV